MDTFRFSFLLVFILNTAIVNAQQFPVTLGYVKMSFLNTFPSKNYINNYQQKNVATTLQIVDSSKVNIAPSGISSAYYTQHLGLMCKEELKLEKAIKFPVKIRLGSKEQVDYLEGKYNRH